MNPAAAPFADGALSLRLYGHGGTAAEVLDAFRTQAARADAAGFDGVTVSEHHGGFPGYLPNPLQLAGWILDRCPNVWAAPFPLLLPLRAAGLVAEEVAWLHVRFPGRVGVGVAAGSLPQDFDIAGTPLDDTLAARFAAGLSTLAAALGGAPNGPLAGDQAIAGLVPGAVPLLSAAMSDTAARRAAAAGVGLLSDSISARGHLAHLGAVYRDAGGDGPYAVTRWVWVGEIDAGRIADELRRYRSYTPADRQARWGAEPDVLSGPADRVGEALVDVASETGATCLNLRVHVGGVHPAEALEQIDRLGAEVLPGVRAALPGTQAATGA